MSNKVNDTKKEQIISLLSQYCSKNEIEQFTLALNKAPLSAFILNKNKISNDEIEKLLPMVKKDDEDNLVYRYNKDELKIGKSILNFAGALYPMDASSSYISLKLKDIVKDKPLVADLCAAPGGKSIAFSIRRSDALILANDISYQRALEITKNVDRLGLSNIMSMSIDPMKLDLGPIFDLIILDVPCSGSGMIRKEEKMMDDWSFDKVEHLLPIQENLLEKAYSLLKKDGIIAYSTCSLSIDENENQIKKIIAKHNDLEEIKVDVLDSVVKGEYGYHLLPGVYNGEGIYFCFLKKMTGSNYECKEIKYKKPTIKTNLNTFLYKKNEYLIDRMYGELTDLNFISPGIKIYDDSQYSKCQFDYAYSKLAYDIFTLEIEENDAINYMLGNEIKTDNKNNGLVILTYKNLRLGFGKIANGKIKNYLPKGLRILNN